MNFEIRPFFCRGFVAAVIVSTMMGETFGVEKFDKDSIAYILSRNFVEITQGDDGGLLFHPMPDMGANCVLDLRTGECQCYEPGTVVRLQDGEQKSFGIIGVAGGLVVTLTNGCTVTGRTDIPDRFARADKLLWIEREKTAVIKRRVFVIDVDGGVCHDVERGETIAFKLPFEALWKDSRDMIRKRLDTDLWQKLMADDYSRLISRAAENGSLRSHCGAMPDGKSDVVCFEKEVNQLGGTNFLRTTYLAEVSRHGTNMLLHALARFDEGGNWNVVCLDANGRPRFARAFVSASCSSHSCCYFEFEGDCKLARYVCECVADSDTSVYRGDDALCGNAGDDRSAINAFITEVVAATKHTEDAWRDATYVTVCETPELPSVQDAVRRAARENLEEDGRERKRLEEAWNAERKSKGLPGFTREEMRRKWDGHLFELKIAEMAALRIKMNGGRPTTELDRAFDVERAKVEMMGMNVERYMAEMRCKTRNFKAPENLRQLIGVKALGRVLLPDGEKDLIDGWGHEYGYRIEKRARPDGTEREYPAVISAGADGVFGTDDDIDSRKLFELEKLFGK